MSPGEWWVLCRTVERYGFKPERQSEPWAAALEAGRYVERRAGTLYPTAKGSWYYATRWTMFYRRHAVAQVGLFE